jgi:multiple sugar transport system permease protein
MTTASLDRNKTLGLTLAGVLVTVYLLAPFSWLVLTSVMHERDALSVPPQWIPKDATLENYRIFFDPSGTRAIVGSRAAAQMLPGMLNSLIAALGTAILNLVLGTLAAYSLARFEFRGRTTLLLLYLGSRMLPGIALIVPLYLMMKTYGLLDNLAALVVTYLTFTLPFTIWLLRNYFQGVPRSLEAAALIDGCNWLQMVTKILLPAATPGLVAAGMFAFMTAWNDYLFAVILTHIQMMRFPALQDLGKGPMGWSRLYGISSETKVKDAAWRLIYYLGGKDAKGEYFSAKDWYLKYGIGYPFKSLDQDPDIQAAQRKTGYDLEVLRQQFANSRARENINATWYSEWDRFTQQQIQSALLRQVKPAEALAASAKKAQDLKKSGG